MLLVVHTEGLVDEGSARAARQDSRPDNFVLTRQHHARRALD